MNLATSYLSSFKCVTLPEADDRDIINKHAFPNSSERSSSNDDDVVPPHATRRFTSYITVAILVVWYSVLITVMSTYMVFMNDRRRNSQVEGIDIQGLPHADTYIGLSGDPYDMCVFETAMLELLFMIVTIRKWELR